jgi:maltooligosyltrehalose trehalohydrolase
MATDPARATSPEQYPVQRPLGARPVSDALTEFRVWAPRASSGVQLALGARKPELLAMEPVGYGVYELTAPAPVGTDYRYVIGRRRLPDPASRFQPAGLNGPSRVVGTAGCGLGGPPGGPGSAPRPDAAPGLRTGPEADGAPGFRAAPLNRQVIYELHIGTFSPAGTFDGAIPYLAGLAQLGATAVEVMPVGEFPGHHGWGYDGVYISAVQSSYGGPDGLAAFVAAAHDCGLAVILDVVYNHLGPGSDALERFGPYFTTKYATPWGSALNYDDAGSDAVREWACQSAEGWIRDYGVDGLRLDAVHAIYDTGPEHLVAEISRRVHAINPRALVIAESALNDPKVMRKPGRGGWGCDAAWADDFHHSVRTLLTEEREGYYADFGTVADLAKALGRRPYVYDGVYSPAQGKRVGAPADDLAAAAFVVCTQNHDQVGNRAFGDRLAPAVRPLAAMLNLLSGFTPMLFMGEEYGEPAPFQFFCDHIDPEIAEATRRGRRAEFAAFASFGHEVPDPMDPATFADSKLTRESDPELAELYRRLIALRRGFLRGGPAEVAFDEAARWLTLTRGPFQLVANFAAAAQSFPARGYSVELAGGAPVTLARGKLTLAPRSGVVLKQKETSE